MSNEHVEVLRNLSEVCRAAIKAGDWKVDGACDPDAVLRRADSAIAALSAPQPPAEAQAQGGGEVFGWVLGDAFVDARFWTAGTPPQGWTPVYCTAPPSAPVGVEAQVSALQSVRDRMMAALTPKFGDAFDGDFDVMLEAINTMKRFRMATLAQQPAADGGFTAADMMDARQEGREEAQQLAGFSAGDMADAAAQGFRDGVASVGAVDEAMERVRRGPDRLWQADLVGGQISIDRMHEILNAALAAQQGGSDDR